MKKKILILIILISAILIAIFLILINQNKQACMNIESGEIRCIDQTTEKLIENIINDDFNSEKEVLIIPSSRVISIKKPNNDLGFILLVRNLDIVEKEIKYKITAYDENIPENCNIDTIQAKNFIQKTEGSFNLKSGEYKSELIKFIIPESSPTCIIKYTIETEGLSQNQTVFDLIIK